MRFLRQTVHLLALSLSVHRARPRDGLLVCVGFLVAAVTLVFLLAIPAGIDRITADTGQTGLVMVLSELNEANSQISPEQIAIVSQLPQVARDGDGRPLVVPQFVVNTRLSRSDGEPVMLMLRGVSDQMWTLLDPSQAHLDGHLREGTRQIVASRRLVAEFPVLQQSTFIIQGREWQLAGHLDTGGNLWESELWTDLSALQAAYNRPGAVSSLWLKLTSSDQFRALIDAIDDDPRLTDISGWSQYTYYRWQVGEVSDMVRLVAAGVSVLLGLGAVLVISTMLDISLLHRCRQIATLRALGFDTVAVVLAIMLEVLLAGLFSALVSVLVLWLWLDGVSFGASSYNQAVYAVFVVNVEMVMMVVGYSLVLGLVGMLRPLRNLLKGSLVRAL